MFRRLAAVALLSFACLLPAVAGAAPELKDGKPKDGPGTLVVRQAYSTIQGLLGQKVPAGSKEEKELAVKVTTNIRGFLDIDQLGMRAMTDQWSKLTKAQQDEFLKLLRELIEDNYIRGLRANLEYTVVYTGETTDPDGNVLVTTRINTKRKGRPYTIEVDYVLVKDGGKLRAFDIRTDGVGLVENYRSSFNKIIAKDGFAGLIAKMKKKQAGMAAPGTAPS